MIRETVWTTWVDLTVKSWFGVCQSCQYHITKATRYCPGCGLEFHYEREWEDFNDGDVLLLQEEAV